MGSGCALASRFTITGTLSIIHPSARRSFLLLHACKILCRGLDPSPCSYVAIFLAHLVYMLRAPFVASLSLSKVDVPPHSHVCRLLAFFIDRRPWPPTALVSLRACSGMRRCTQSCRCTFWMDSLYSSSCDMHDSLAQCRACTFVWQRACAKVVSLYDCAPSDRTCMFL